MPAKSEKTEIVKAKKKLGKLIAKCRESKMSQRQLANAVGLSPSNMKYIEDGINSPTAEIYSKLINIHYIIISPDSQLFCMILYQFCVD